MENKRKLTKEDFLKVLQHIYPLGYAGDTDKWKQTWFVGWLGRWDGHAVVEINYDADTIVFWLIYYNTDEVTADIATGYIKGMMEVVMPDMYCNESFYEGHDTISYEFKED